MATDHGSTISDNSLSPAEVEQDGTRAKSHSIKDQIAADRYFRETRKRGLGIGFRRMVPPGADG